MEKRIHIIPLRRSFLKSARWKRTPRSIKAIREYVWKHYRTTNIIIGKYLNEHIWAKGSKNPPSKVKVVAIKDGDKVSLELEGKYVEPVKKEMGLKEKVASKIPLKKKEASEEKKAVVEPEAKEEKPIKKEVKTPLKKETKAKKTTKKAIKKEE